MLPLTTQLCFFLLGPTTILLVLVLVVAVLHVVTVPLGTGLRRLDSLALSAFRTVAIYTTSESVDSSVDEEIVITDGEPVVGDFSVLT